MSGFERDPAQGIGSATPTFIACPDAGGHLRSSDARIAEAEGLCLAIGLKVVSAAAFRIRQAKPAALFGSGQVEDIAERIKTAEAELLVVDGALTPIQQRNLEKAVKCKVIDRTGLILEIFGARAATAEGRLQVELAHLDYQAGRLVRSWTHLERQRGGFGFLGGPGETQIEADRRLIRNRMAKIRRELEEVTRTRGLHRSRRQRAPWPVIALVGYTNAGKSTLFNRMTRATVLAEDLLFATLDPTMREISLPGLDKAILSDTVGFVSDLPTQLVAAFRATLEEVVSADLILHVRDISHSDSDAQADDVHEVLRAIGAEGEGTAPIVEVWNKFDQLSAERAEFLNNEAERREDTCLISALTGIGLDKLNQVISDKINIRNRLREISLNSSEGAALAWLHKNGTLEQQLQDGDTVHVQVRLSDADFNRFQARFARDHSASN